jgi:hypothetical protein
MEEKNSRVEKYKKHRQDIENMDTFRFDSYSSIEDDADAGDKGMSEDELKDEHVKKSTLSIPIEDLIKAHDEYTTQIDPEEIRRQKKEANKVKFRKYKNFIIFGGIVIALIIVIVALLIVLLTK